jgi:molybdate transport system permease protein
MIEKLRNLHLLTTFYEHGTLRWVRYCWPEYIGLTIVKRIRLVQEVTPPPITGVQPPHQQNPLGSEWGDAPAGQGKPTQLGALTPWLQNAWRLTALPMILLFAVPLVMLFAHTSPAQLWHNLQQEQVIQAINISLRTTLMSLAVTIVLGTPLAYLMGRCQFRFKRLLDTLIDLPTLLPPSVAGVALLITLGRKGIIGGWLETWGIHIAFTQAAVVLAQVFIAAPFYVRAATIGFAGMDRDIEQAAQLDGAGRWKVFQYIMLPLSKNALISGAMLSWSRALGEFGATMIFAGNFPGRTQTMPTAIYLGFEVDMNLALTLSVILLTVAFLSILLVKSLSYSRPEE